MDVRVELLKKPECWRIDAFELWCGEDVPWTARRSNQSIIKEISPGCSLEGLMLKLKLQYFGHLMRKLIRIIEAILGKQWDPPPRSPSGKILMSQLLAVVSSGSLLSSLRDELNSACWGYKGLTISVQHSQPWMAISPWNLPVGSADAVTGPAWHMYLALCSTFLPLFPF